MSRLFVGGDWACAHGDLGTLAHGASLLALCVAEPLRHDLLDVVRMCRENSDHATSRWYEVRARLRLALRSLEPGLQYSS